MVPTGTGEAGKNDGYKAQFHPRPGWCLGNVNLKGTASGSANGTGIIKSSTEARLPWEWDETSGPSNTNTSITLPWLLPVWHLDPEVQARQDLVVGWEIPYHTVAYGAPETIVCSSRAFRPLF